MKRKTTLRSQFDLFEPATITGSYCDLAITMHCAFSYALGRQTYVTDVVPGIILRNISVLADGDLQVMIDRIDEKEKCEYGLGSPSIDAPVWRRFRDNLKAELAARQQKKPQ